ncbi:MAG: hypothetical protein CMK63_11150 [Pseudoalteromonadaceae bacterium]|nr:hypothetical protein [Pseudoalteromonadaceae bacterium]
MGIVFGVCSKAFLLIALILAAEVSADTFLENLELDSRVRFHGQSLKATSQPIFATDDTSSLFSALDMSAESEGLRLAATASINKVAGSSETKLTISEAYYDFSIKNWYLSSGKKKLDWDVGYGFRPLDMFSPTDSLAIYTAVPPGTLMATGDYFTESGNVTFICNETRAEYLERGEKVKPGYGCGGRYYQFFDGYEAQAVVHYDNVLGFRVGGSALTVIGNSLELHGSFIWQQRHRTPIVTAHHGFNNVETVWQKGSLQALLGLNYSFSVGITAIVEYWHDGRAPSNKQWRDVIAGASEGVSEHQLSLYRAHFATQNLFRDNLMVHLRSSNSTWQPEVTWLMNPSDNSMLIDTGLCYSKYESIRLCLGYRSYAGGNKSIYEQLSYQKIGYLSVEIKL